MWECGIIQVGMPGSPGIIQVGMWDNPCGNAGQPREECQAGGVGARGSPGGRIPAPRPHSGGCRRSWASWRRPGRGWSCARAAAPGWSCSGGRWRRSWAGPGALWPSGTRRRGRRGSERSSSARRYRDPAEFRGSAAFPWICSHSSPLSALPAPPEALPSPTVPTETTAVPTVPQPH